MKKMLVLMLVTGLCLTFMGVATADEPSFGTITLNPETPTRQSEVTFSVDVTGDDIEEVYVKVQECYYIPSYQCHTVLLNVSLEDEDGTWEGSGTLQYDNTDEGHCWLEILLSNGTWYDYGAGHEDTWTNFTVVAGDDGTDGGDTGGDGEEDTPGFELLIVVVSLILALFIYKKKRIK